MTSKVESQIKATKNEQIYNGDVIKDARTLNRS